MFSEESSLYRMSETEDDSSGGWDDDGGDATFFCTMCSIVCVYCVYWREQKEVSGKRDMTISRKHYGLLRALADHQNPYNFLWHVVKETTPGEYFGRPCLQKRHWHKCIGTSSRNIYLDVGRLNKHNLNVYVHNCALSGSECSPKHICFFLGIKKNKFQKRA